MKKVNSLHVKLFRNGEHYTYHAAVLELLNDNVTNSLGISALHSAYVELFKIEDLSLKSEIGDRNTKLIAEKDAARDKIFNYISGTISLQCSAPDDTVVAAAENLTHLFKGYKNLPSRTYGDESALITNLLQDLKKPPYDADANTLNLTTLIESLKKLNDEFIQLYADRNVNATERADVPSMAAIRPQVDSAYRKLISVINSLYEVNEMIQHDDEKKKILNSIIDTLNARIAKESQNLAVRKGRSTVTGEEEEEEEEEETEFEETEETEETK